MRWLRLILAIIFAKNRPKLTVNEPSVIPFRVWLTDIDASIMNHAAIMTVMETGRIDLMVRSGFFKLARTEKWYFPTSAISVQFYRPLKTFQRAILRTQVLHVTSTHIYLEQKIMRGEKEMARCVVKSTVKKGREVLDIPAIIRRLGAEWIPTGTTAMIDAFEKHHSLLKENQ